MCRHLMLDSCILHSGSCHYITAMVGSPDKQSATAGCMENKQFGHSCGALCCLIADVISHHPIPDERTRKTSRAF